MKNLPIPKLATVEYIQIYTDMHAHTRVLFLCLLFDLLKWELYYVDFFVSCFALLIIYMGFTINSGYS